MRDIEKRQEHVRDPAEQAARKTASVSAPMQMQQPMQPFKYCILGPGEK